MFNRHPPGSGEPPPAPPGQDSAGSPMMLPEVPAMRTFRVSRVIEGALTRTSEDIHAHDVEINQIGNIIKFREYMNHPTEGPTFRVVRCFLRPPAGWFEYEEILPLVGSVSLQ